MQSNPDTTMVFGPTTDDNSSGIQPFMRAGIGGGKPIDPTRQATGANYVAQGTGGVSGANAGQETLPGRGGRGVAADLQARRNASVPSGYGNFGMDVGNQVTHGMGGEADANKRAGVVETHGCSGARGGHYFCEAKGCSYKSRSSHGMNQHKRAHERKHAMGEQGSSGATGSTSSVGSSSVSG